MFLNKVLENNPEFVETVITMHQRGMILPDTYVIDVDQFIENAKNILVEANKKNISLYYMLKQVGHNPYLGRILENIGYKGAVAVDQKEAEVLMKNGLTICHAGHLVQPSFAFVDKLIDYGCEHITIYSLEKAKEINASAKKHNKLQSIFIRVTSKEDMIYPGQTAGFEIKDFEKLVFELLKLENIKISGITSFPCFLYSEKDNRIIEQENIHTLLRAKKILESIGINDIEVNAPSCTCTKLISDLNSSEVTSMEPGHGLTGTTPYHAHNNTYEKQCVIYLSEVSHNYNSHAYAFGGGYYRRGHLQNALIISADKKEICHITEPSLESIDYHFELDNEYDIGSTVLMAFRFQAFVSRSDVCLIKGIKSNKPMLLGLYSCNGELKSE